MDVDTSESKASVGETLYLQSIEGCILHDAVAVLIKSGAVRDLGIMEALPILLRKIKALKSVALAASKSK